jgi:hypothetical protein
MKPIRSSVLGLLLLSLSLPVSTATAAPPRPAGRTIFNLLYLNARIREDVGQAARIRASYLDHQDTMMTFFEGLSRDTFGREIPGYGALTKH